LIYIFFINWELGIGVWGLGIGPTPHSPIPNPQSPIPTIPFMNKNKYIFKFNLKNVQKIK